MKNTEKYWYRRELFFPQVFSDDVFHIQFLIMYYKKILSRFLDFLPIVLYHTPPNKLSQAFSIWRFPILLLHFDHRLMKVLLIISVPRMFVWRPISDISNHEKRKRLQTGKKT